MRVHGTWFIILCCALVFVTGCRHSTNRHASPAQPSTFEAESLPTTCGNELPVRQERLINSRDIWASGKFIGGHASAAVSLAGCTSSHGIDVAPAAACAWPSSWHPDGPIRSVLAQAGATQVLGTHIVRDADEAVLDETVVLFPVEEAEAATRLVASLPYCAGATKANDAVWLDRGDGPWTVISRSGPVVIALSGTNIDKARAEALLVKAFNTVGGWP